MKKLSTFLTMAVCALAFSLQAQDTVSYYGWEEGTTFGPVGSIWNNDGVTWTHEIVTGDAANAHTGEGYFKAIVSEDPPQQWDNQGVFQEIHVQDSTSYRLGFWMKADGDNTLINITSGTYNNWVEIQTKRGVKITSDWKYYSLMLYNTTSELMDLIDADGRYEDTIRYPIHYYSAGTFYVDDVTVIKSTIAGISYNDTVLAVDYGYNLDYTPQVMPDAYTITVDGAEVAAKKGVMVIAGNVFEPKIYLTLESSIPEGAKVLVDYDGNEDLYYSSYSPPSGDTYKALAFEGEAAFYDPSLEIPAVSGTVGTQTFKFNIYPNPAQDELYIDSDQMLAGVAIYDLTGRNLMNNTRILNRSTYTIDISSLAQGTYLVKLTNNNGDTSVKRFVK